MLHNCVWLKSRRVLASSRTFSHLTRSVVRFQPGQCNQRPDGDNHKDKDNQQLLLNLGQYLDDHIPHLLQNTLPTSILAPGIALRLLPHSHPYLPVVKGRVAYNSVIRLLQFTITSALVKPDAKIHIISSRLEGVGNGSTSSTVSNSPNLTVTGNSSGSIPSRYIVRWRTCSPDWCSHPDDQVPNSNHDSSSTSQSFHDHKSTNKISNTSSSSSPSSGLGIPLDLAAFLNILPKPNELTETPKFLMGIFEFDLDSTRTCITCHTIQDVELVSDSPVIYTDPKALGTV